MAYTRTQDLHYDLSLCFELRMKMYRDANGIQWSSSLSFRVWWWPSLTIVSRSNIVPDKYNRRWKWKVEKDGALMVDAIYSPMLSEREWNWIVCLFGTLGIVWPPIDYNRHEWMSIYTPTINIYIICNNNNNNVASQWSLNSLDN